MAKKPLDTMTESMFYTMLALSCGPRCGIDITQDISRLTDKRIILGPGTLYTILSKFLEVGYIRQVDLDGRKRTYEITDKGIGALNDELSRLRQCLSDAVHIHELEKEKTYGKQDSEDSDPALCPV